MRGYQAQQGRELSRCLKELRQLRRDALAECTGEPDATSQNGPASPSLPANDDARPTGSSAPCPPSKPRPNEPKSTWQKEPEPSSASAVLPSEPERSPPLNRHQRRALQAIVRQQRKLAA